MIKQRLSFIAWFLVFSACSFSQPLRSGLIAYYDYSTVLNDLIRNGNKSKYYANLDYESMLYLDKTSFKVLNEVNPLFLIKKNIDTTNIYFNGPQKYVNELQVNFTSIEQLFWSSDTLKNIILRLNRTNLDNKSTMMIKNNIYIKDSQKAIITIFVGNWDITYRVILTGKILRFEELYETLED